MAVTPKQEVEVVVSEDLRLCAQLKLNEAVGVKGASLPLSPTFFIQASLVQSQTEMEMKIIPRSAGRMTQQTKIF